MQERHQNRKQYFTELANTSRNFYLDYLRSEISLTAQTRVLEIGCGEGGNLLPFAEIGCQVTGIDLSETRIEQAREFFAEADALGIEVQTGVIAGGSDASKVKASGVTAKVGLFGHARENSHGLEVAYAAVFENVIRVLTHAVLQY